MSSPVPNPPRTANLERPVSAAATDPSSSRTSPAPPTDASNTPNETPKSASLSTSPPWKSFVDRQASNFAELFYQRLFSDLSPSEVKEDVLLAEVSQHFAEQVGEHIKSISEENDLVFASAKLCDILNKGNAVVAEGNSEYVAANAVNSTNFEHGAASLDAAGSGRNTGCSASNSKYKNFFRRFSFRGFTKGRGFNVFHKQYSDEVELSSAASNNGDNHPYLPHQAGGNGSGSGSGEANHKMKTCKISVECVKEGAVNYIPGGDTAIYDGKPRWQKCKLCLVRASGGYMIELFDPPKVRVKRERIMRCSEIKWDFFDSLPSPKPESFAC